MYTPRLVVLFGFFSSTSSALVPNDIISLEYSHSRNAVSSATIVTNKQNLSIEPEAHVAIYSTFLNMPRSIPVFTGYVDRIEYDAVQKIYTIHARDVLKKALDTFLIQEVKFGVDVEQQKYYYSTYSDRFGGSFAVHEYSSLAELNASHPETLGNITAEGVKAHAVVQWLLVMCGISERTSIQVHESNFFIGDITPVTFHLVSVYDAIQQIADLLGWDFYADREGICRFHPSFRNAVGGANEILQAYILQASRVVSNEELRNYVEVMGASGILARARSPSPYLGSTPYRGVLVSNEFIDTPSIANYFARRILHDLNRLKRTYALTTLPFFIHSIVDPLRVPVLSPNILRIESYGGSFSVESGYTTTIQASDYLEDFDYDVPETFVLADFSVQYQLTIGDPKMICVLDAEPSRSTVADIVFWQWTIGHASGTQTLYGKQVFVALDEAQLKTSGVQITLLVRDDAHNTGTKTKLVTYDDVLASSFPRYRVLYAASPTSTFVSSDGGSTWFSAPIPSRHVAPSHYDVLGSAAVQDAYVLIVGLDGALYRSSDLLQTYTSVVAPSSLVAAAVSPSSPNIAYCANATTLYKSENSGVTFSPVFSFASHGFGAVLSFEVVRFDADYVYVCCAPSTSYPDGALVILNTATNAFFDIWNEWKQPGERPLYYVGGVVGSFDEETRTAVQWVVTNQGVLAHVDGRVARYTADIVSLTPDLIDIKRAHVVSSSGEYGTVFLSKQGAQLLMTYSSNGAVPTSFAFAVRDGDAVPVLYYAASDGVRKSVDRHKTVHMLGEIGACTHVAYGPFMYPIKKQTALVVLSNALLDVAYDSEYTVTSQRRSLFVATAPSGVLGSSLSTATSGFMCVQRPNHIGSITVTDVHAGYVVGFAQNTNNPITLPSPYYTHPYPLSRYPLVPVLYQPTVSGVLSPSGVSVFSSGLCIPDIEALSSDTTRYIDLRSILVSQRSVPSLVTLARVTPPPYTLGGRFHTVFEYGLHNIPSGILYGTSASLQAPIELLAEDQLPPRGQAGLETRLRYDVAGVSTVYPSTHSATVSIRGSVAVNKNHFVHVHSTPSTVQSVTSVSLDTSEDVIPVTKFAAVSYSIAKHITDDIFFLVTNKSSSLTTLSWSVPPYQGVAQRIVSVHASRRSQSSFVYYATQTTLYRVSDYGRGQAETVFAVPDEIAPTISNGQIVGGISAFSITSDRLLAQDCIAVVIRSPTGAYPNGYIAVSLDSGTTWMYHRWTCQFSNGTVHNAWWVVS